MSEARRRVTMKDLIAGGHVPWKSAKTIIKKIHEEGFPGILDGGNWYFDLTDVDVWFKKRVFKAG